MKTVVKVLVVFTVVIVAGAWITKVVDHNRSIDDAITNAVGTVRVVDCSVSNIDNDDDVMFVDKQGERYEVCDVDYTVNDKVRVWIDDNNTPNDKTDDVVIEHKKIGSN